METDTDRTEQSLPERITACARDVQSTLPSGLRENAYHQALLVALADEGIQFTTEATIPVLYRDFPVARIHPDLIVGDDERYILELKVDRDGTEQLRGYLKFADKNDMDVSGGIAISFGSTCEVDHIV